MWFVTIPLSLSTQCCCCKVLGVYTIVDTSQEGQVRVANFITLEVNHSNSDIGAGARLEPVIILIFGQISIALLLSDN